MKSKAIWDSFLYNNDDDKQNFINETNILIIGGGIAGLTSAYLLKNKKLNIALIDKDKIINGITSKTTAKISHIQKAVYSTLAKNFNKNVSKLYLDSQLEAIDIILSIIQNEKIECDLGKCDSYIFTKNKNGIKKINDEKRILEEFKIECKIQDKIPIKNFKILKSLKVNNTYTFNPVKYLQGIVKSINNYIKISENTIATNISHSNNKIKVDTNKGTIICDKVLVCCHYPFFLFPGLIPIKTYIKQEYVNAARYQHNRHFTAISIDNNLHSIRFYNDYIIYGSNSHRLTNKINYEKNYLKSKSDFKRIFSKEPEYTWMNRDVITNDVLPLIGKINESNILIATGFNAWGMTNATIAGKILSDIVLNKKSPYENLFSPTRVNKTNIYNSLFGLFNYAKVYIQTSIKRNPTFYNNYVYTVKINKKYYGVYYDSYNKRHIVSLKCPHMKCNLVFNNYEKTWDCPCHGSRFDIDGKLITGPSKKEISRNQDFF